MPSALMILPRRVMILGFMLLLLDLPASSFADQLHIGSIAIDSQMGNPNYFVFGSADNPFKVDNSASFYGTATREDSDFLASLLIQLVIVKTIQPDAPSAGSLSFSLGGYNHRPGNLTSAGLRVSGQIAGATAPTSVSVVGQLIGPPLALGPVTATWRDVMPFDKSTGVPVPQNMSPPFTFVEQIGWNFDRGNRVGTAILLNYGSELRLEAIREPSALFLFAAGLALLVGYSRGLGSRSAARSMSKRE